jgi:hypothetical protein
MIDLNNGLALTPLAPIVSRPYRRLSIGAMSALTT